MIADNNSKAEAPTDSKKETPTDVLHLLDAVIEIQVVHMDKMSRYKNALSNCL
jgi:hypothetical protein